MAYDGTLMFGTGIDNSGFENDVKQLNSVASVAVGNITSNIITQVSSAIAQIPQQMVTVGSSFEASMSQVAATMGITADTTAFDTLSAAAKEMGESTKFSASQAGEALNYLALAGYDANKAVAALPTVLNVAAAGGMELASASDMITDAMSALGLETSQMADFSDKLAVTAQKSNTSVSQLGEAILTVGGTAKTLSGGVTEMNTALGILADNGIKGSEGGTMLRNVILSLSAPTSTVAAALESLGVTAFDASGTMRPLQDTFSDLNTALSSLSQQEQTEALSQIFNKVDLKGVNALLGTSAERFDELSGYIDNCSGAAAQMAKTMDDNLQGDLTILGSTLEGLGIAAYEKFQEPMRTAVQSVTGSVGELTENLTSGELYNSFENISNGFSDIVDSGAELLTDKIIPGIINGVDWIIDNFGVLKTVTITVTTAVIAYQTAVNGAATAQALLNAAMNTNPFVLAASAIIGVTAAIAAYVSEADAAIKTQEELQQEADGIISKSQSEANMAEYKAERYKQLYEQYKKTGEASLEMKMVAEDLQRLAPDTIDLIDEETGAYKALDDSINDVIDSIRRKGIEQAKQNTLQGHYENITEYSQRQIEAENKYQEYIDYLVSLGVTADEISELEKGVNGKFAAFFNGDFDSETVIDGHGYDWFSTYASNFMYMHDQRDAEIDKWQTKINEEQTAIKRLDTAYSNLYETQNENTLPTYTLGGTNYKFSAQMAAEEYANNYTAEMQSAAGEISSTQEEINSTLASEWKRLEHNYATGVITSEKNLYAQKSALLAQYGSADLEDHWKYYEDLHKMENDFAEQSAEDTKKAAENHKKQMSDEWNSIERMQSIGVLSAEDAYKKQLAFIEKYCAEYSDEWYDYYQTIIEYQRQSLEKQIDTAKENIKKLVAEYKSAYSDLESDIKSYKNRLLSVGDLFSVDKDKDGKTTVSVENMRKQMAEMQKYHNYISKLKAKGASRELISELTSMDFENGSFTAKNLANMSDAEFKEINDLYTQKQKLADELSKELYEPEMQKLNDNLAKGVIDEFRKLPPEIQEIGIEAVWSFIEGLSSGDISKNIDKFTEQFTADCKKGIEKAFENTELDFAALMKNDNYSMGKSAGEEYVKGFNEAISQVEQVQTAAASEQSYMSNSAASESQYRTAKGGNNSSKNYEKIVLKNYVNTTVELDKKAVGKTSYEYEKEYERQADQ